MLFDTQAHAAPMLSPEEVQQRFLVILPGIERAASYWFRHRQDDEREEAIQEVIASAFVAFVRLAERGRLDAALPTPLAAYAIRQFHAGRRVGSRAKRQELMSRASGEDRPQILSIHDRNPLGVELCKLLVETKHAGPAETAAARLDLAAWFRTLPKQRRQIARTLARGESTSAVAQRYKLTAGRVSQLRRELREAWCRFAGEPVAA